VWKRTALDECAFSKTSPSPGTEIFVVGDTAALNQDGKPLPGVAQVAMQEGRYAGDVIRRRAAQMPARPPFRYFDKGTMAVVGPGYAILQSGKLRLSGFVAWLARGEDCGTLARRRGSHHTRSPLKRR
jgi:NADH dehydrogenase FAD-containing subunit